LPGCRLRTSSADEEERKGTVYNYLSARNFMIGGCFMTLSHHA